MTLGHFAPIGFRLNTLDTQSRSQVAVNNATNLERTQVQRFTPSVQTSDESLQSKKNTRLFNSSVKPKPVKQSTMAMVLKGVRNTLSLAMEVLIRKPVAAAVNFTRTGSPLLPTNHTNTVSTRLPLPTLGEPSQHQDVPEYSVMMLEYQMNSVRFAKVSASQQERYNVPFDAFKEQDLDNLLSGHANKRSMINLEAYTDYREPDNFLKPRELNATEDADRLEALSEWARLDTKSYILQWLNDDREPGPATVKPSEMTSISDRSPTETSSGSLSSSSDELSRQDSQRAEPIRVLDRSFNQSIRPLRLRTYKVDSGSKQVLERPLDLKDKMGKVKPIHSGAVDTQAVSKDTENEVNIISDSPSLSPSSSLSTSSTLSTSEQSDFQDANSLSSYLSHSLGGFSLKS